MPQFNAKTMRSASVWRSPDGQREIWEVTLDVNGQTFKANTFSDKISSEGFSGDVETWEKPGNGGRPSQTFVKQVPKEGGYSPQPQGSPQSSTGQGSSKPAYVPKDEKAIQAMWAITKAVEITGPVAEPDFTKLLEYATEFMAMVDVVKDGEPAQVRGDETDAELSDNMNSTLEDVTNEPITIQDLNNLFPEDEAQGGKPWGKAA